jgi:extracellular factor (EF) 3-hydroxypalmitic acid methyl ester biosynthesis protein
MAFDGSQEPSVVTHEWVRAATEPHRRLDDVAVDPALDSVDHRGTPFEELEGASGAAVVYRPDRYAPADFGPVVVTLTVAGATGEVVDCPLVNVSQTGLAFAPSEDLVCRPGDVLTSVSLRSDDEAAYDGRALVRTVRTVGEGTLVGAEFLDYLLSIDDVLRLRDLKAAHQSSADALSTAASAWRVEGHHEFKSRVAELSLFLQSAKKQFERLEASLDWEDVHSREETPAKRRLLKAIDQDFSQTYLQWSEEVNALYVALDSADAELLKAYSRGLLHPLVMEAPVTRRMFDKPLGYAGDYLVMSYFYARQRFEGNTLFAKAMHRATSNQTAARAVRHRKEMLKKGLEERIGTWPGKRPLRIVSVASGPAQELYEVLLELSPEAPPLEVLIFDQDRQALQYAQTRLLSVIRSRRLAVRLVPLHDSIKFLIPGESVLMDRGPYDHCLMSGLMDYLYQPVGRRLVAQLYHLLSPGGECWVGNVAPWNPTRWAMEHLYEWHLIYRSIDELAELAGDLPPGAESRTIADELGLIPFLVIRRPE